MAGDGAVEDVLAGFVDLQMNDAATGLCQREVDIGHRGCLRVLMLLRTSQVRDVDIGVYLVDLSRGKKGSAQGQECPS